MNKNIIETALGALVIVIAILFFMFGFNASHVKTGNAYTLNAEFSEIGTIDIGSDVKISGVKIGSVKALSLNEVSYRAIVTVSIRQDIEIPEDSSALITSSGLLGGSYISLSPGGSDVALEDGEMISYTQDAQNLERLLGKFIFNSQDNADE